MRRRFRRKRAGQQTRPSAPQVEPVIYRDRLVALAGRDRCHVIDVSLTDAEILLVATMCLYVRLTRGGPRGPVISAEAEAWARRYLAELSTPP